MCVHCVYVCVREGEGGREGFLTAMKLGMVLCVGLLMMRNLRPLNSIREGAPAVSR